MIRIQRIRGSRAGEAPVQTSRARVVLGRDLDADLVFSEPMVHGRHAEIVFQNGRYEIAPPRDRPADRYNGLFLHTSAGEVRLSGARPLRHGDRVYLGPNGPGVEVTFLFDRGQVGSAAPAQQASTPRPVILIAVVVLLAMVGLLIALAAATA